MMPRPFVPAWLNQAGLSQADFRVYCCLVARADVKTGIAWPKAETIASDCFMARRTVWKSLRSLEEKKFIRRKGKRFADSNRYQVLVPIGANEAPIEEPPIGANEAPIGAAPIGAFEAPPIGANNAPPIGAFEAPGKTTNKGNQGKVTNKNSMEAIQFATWFRSSLPDGINLKANWQQSFAKTYDDLVRIDKRQPEQIRAVCQWARSDGFWKSNFMSPGKLRKRNTDGITYFDLFAEKMKQPSPQHSNGTGKDDSKRYRPAGNHEPELIEKGF
jgi:DNA-binding MarR family transcriptional regulator